MDGNAGNKTPWQRLMNRKFLGRWDFNTGEEKIVTIKGVFMDEVFNDKTMKVEMKPTIRFMEDVKPIVMNVTNAKRIAELYGSDEVEDWAGKKVILVVESEKRTRKIEKGIRIKQKLPDQHNNPICGDCKKEIPPFAGYTADQIATMTSKKFGRPLCPDCKQKAQEMKQPTEGEA